jgi:hypothetical protein
MRRTSEEPQVFKPTRQDRRDPGVNPLDRETLEGVMREDVFRAADGKALDPTDFWTPPRRGGRRA